MSFTPPIAYTPKIRIGDANGYVDIDATGFLLGGDAVTQDDVRIALETARPGASNPPGYAKVLDNGAASTGVFAFHFDKTSEEEVFFAVQFPHTRVAESDVNCHVHWMPTDATAGDVVWGLEYTWAPINGVFGTTTIVTGTDAAAGVAYTHQLGPIATITGTGQTASSMMMCRFFRDASNVADTYDADAIAIEVDFHVAIDKLGEVVV